MYKIININTIKTEKEGELSFFQSNDDVDFVINRIYYIHGVKKNTKRGKHAHKKLQQILFCPYGSIDIILDDGYDVRVITLDNPTIGLIIGPAIWREMIWKVDDSVLCVAASLLYDESDYIRDYNEFKNYVKGTKNNGD